MYRLLIADDEGEIRNGLCRFFPWQSVGFLVVGSASNGEEAYDFIQKNEVDIVLCDIVMPCLSGLELAKRLHAERSGIYVVFMSAYTDFQYARQALEYGVKSYILKSAHYDDMIDVFTRIREELDQARAVSPAPGAAQLDVIDQAKQYVRAHYQSVTIEEVSRVIHMNADYLSRLFKRKAGVTFTDFLNGVRMDRAAALLRALDVRTGDVGEMVGYNSPGNFSRAFKNYYGVSPREYRQKL